MKKCTFCDSELLPSKETESAKCWLCGGTEFIDIAEEEIHKQKRENERKGLCCPEPGCSIDLVENYRSFCGNCGTRLEKPTLELWLRKCVEPRLKKESRQVDIDRLALIGEAWQMGLHREGAEKKLDEYVHKIGTSAPPQQEFSTQTRLDPNKSSSESAAYREVLPSYQRKQTRSADGASSTTGRNSAKSFYRHMVSGGTVTNNLVYLSSEKSASKRGLENRAEFLREVANKQGTFILFADADRGWVFPNPALLFTPKELVGLFPSLTTDEYNNFRQNIEPVAVTRAGRGRWKVTGRGNGSANARTKDVTAQSNTAATNTTAVTFPISAVACLEKMQSVGDVVRHDTVRGIVVRGPGGKGELMLIRDERAPKNVELFFVIPRITRFRSSETFDSLYKRYYECAKPGAGDVWIVEPAIVTQVEGGWKLLSKGVLEVRDGGKEVEQKPKVKRPPAIHQPLPEKEQPSANNVPVGSVPVRDVSASPSGLGRFLIVLLMVGGLVLTIFVVWSLTSSTLKRLPNANQNSPSTPTPTPMTRIPGGRFTMGSDGGDEYERPAHPVTVKPFLIDINEVTCEEYEKFIKATGRKAPQDWVNGSYPHGRAHWPVTGVDWYDATAYAAWAKKRLPTEEEWEFAARGTDGRKYPWGNEWRANAANAGDSSAGQFVDVGNYPDGKSPFGAMDMVGNAWEWTASDMQAYSGGRIPDQVSGELKVIRGGFWRSSTPKATATFRRGWDARGSKDGYGNTGFRCAKDL